jgi:aspartyl-tRNA(Asn)/glutamyl-tRNA(Gln) amidotransferase subunit C
MYSALLQYVQTMANITIEDVKHIAKLVKLDVTGEEETLAKMFSETLDFIKVLDELDTSDVEPTYQVNGLTNVFQKNETPKTTLEQKAVLQNAKDKTESLISTKGVFDR